MTKLVSAVRKSLTKTCFISGGMNRRGCKISLGGAPKSHVVVDFDKPGSPLGPEDSRCDYLYVADEGSRVGWVVPLELKKGRLHAGEAVRQLQSGSTAAETLIPSNSTINFRPVAASSSTPKAERNKLKVKANWIRFHDHAEVVRLISCGAALVHVLRR